MKLPLFTWARGYDRGWLRGDVLAGLTVWAVLVPEALAYATIAGVSPVVGLYAAPGALILYAAFGSSRHLVTGPMASTAALSAAAVGEMAAGGSDAFVQLTITMALVVGIFALVAGALRLGFLASFISEPVMKGFIIGLALTIIVGQLPKLFGVEKTAGDFFEQLWGFLGELGNTSGLTLLVGVCSLVLVLGLKAYAPVVPASLVAVILGIGAVSLFDLDVAIVGPVDSGLPSFGLPDVAAHDYLDLSASAIGVLLIGLMEGLGAAKTYAAKNHYEIDVNRELFGMGAANIASGLSSGMVVGGSLSKTAVNGSAGARSQLSGLVVAVLTVITLLFLTGLFENLPEATLAAIVIAAVIELVDVPALVRLYRFHARGAGRAYAVAARPDFVGAVAALAGVLVFDTLPGLFIGIGVSLVLLVYRASRPHIAILGRDPGDDERWNDLQRHPDNEPEPGIVVVRCESALIFANAETVRDAIRAHLEHDTFAIVLDAETVPAIDVTAVSMLVALAHDLRRDGIELAFARDVGDVRELVQLGATGAPLSRYPTVKAAVDALRSKATA
ncbi:SulP family inorganic anion transporter [Solirubrobacter ginsenosidimutans]|uniref:SulP family inorganic anion transporter n=1 Tax=Solirubrobacter ginsenosidimutans TaxID=490573 RepID=A0A9X3SC13_9ACTN|nr:SulP family inorganic anion transporter [Solirubrobacter ginsenosidimutans]MDA0167413.1 SulP family inorganic anion transporter [Solirubrobacter ginsenosidimutans]